MDFYERLKSFMGIRARDSHDDRSGFQNENRDILGDFYSELFGNGNQVPDSEERNFSMSTDALEIHRFFEQQMKDMLKNFGFDGGIFQPMLYDFDGPAGRGGDLPELPERPEGSDNLRDQYLKPGYERLKEGHPKVDRDLDGVLNMGEMFSIFDGEKRNSPTPQYELQKPQDFPFFSKSSSIRIVRSPDGTTETHKTVRDHEGNEEVTITRQMGDKEYTIIKQKDKQGQEQVTEKLVNIDENEAKTLKPLMSDDKSSSWLRFWKS